MTLEQATAPSTGPEPDEAAAAIGPRIYGVIDIMRTDRVAGWAIDRTDHTAALDVDITREGAVIRTVRANRHRPDLARGGLGSGNYGFRAEIDPPLEPGFEFTLVAVARAPDGATAALGRVGGAMRAPDPSTRLLERIYVEVSRLAAATDRAPEPAPRPEVTDVTGAVERLEVVQARIEAALTAFAAPKPPSRDHGLKLIVLVALAIAVASLGVGITSLWRP